MNKYDKLFGEGWARALSPFLESEEFKTIGKFLKQRANEKQIYPLFDNMFKAFKECPYEKVNTVFLTNNAYQIEMDGMAFSINEPFIHHEQQDKIFDAVEQDVANGLYLNRVGDLTRWANQGVLLLNCDLSTEKGAKPGVHLDLWKPFILYVLKVLREYNTGLFYILIGNEAGKYEDHINNTVNAIIKTEHPMLAVREKRPWRYKNIFSDISNTSVFINNIHIDWTIPYTKENQQSYANSGFKLQKI